MSTTTQTRPTVSLAPMPTRSEILTGADYERLYHMGLAARSKGRVIARRLTAPINHEKFFVEVSAAKSRTTRETWMLASYQSITFKGKQRLLVITPEGKIHLLDEATGKREAIAICSTNKYARHIHAMLGQYPALGMN